jgi:D-arabinose 5-phosphate isomerase GutQ
LDDRLAAAVHVLSTEAAALASLTRLYATDAPARDAFSRAVGTIARPAPPHHPRGKLVLIGVGKSGHIARKLTATFNSLSVPATFLHPTEALHGDLGVINSRADTALLITYSGKTPEITAVLPHLDPALPLVLLTGATSSSQHGNVPPCDVVRLRPDAIVLPAPVHELETVSFGLAAPTTSTTAALAVGDALALVCAEELHGGRSYGGKGSSSSAGPSSRVAALFARNHPGGAIGAAAANPSLSPSTTTPAKRPPPATTTSATTTTTTVRQIAAAWKEIPLAVAEPAQPVTPGRYPPHIGPPQPPQPLTAADVLRAGYASPSGWVRVPLQGVVSPSRIRTLRSRDLVRRASDVAGLVVPRRDFVLSVGADATVAQAADWVREMMMMMRGEATTTCDASDGDGDGGVTVCRGDSVVAVLDKGGECVGVLEVQGLLERAGGL